MNELNLNIYEKHLSLEQIGEIGQSKLLAAKIAVIGAGGLGCPAIQYLSAAGVGEILIIDGDHISLTNLQRQFLYGVNDVGELKAKIAQNRIQTLYPHLNIRSHAEFLNPDNAKILLSEIDIVVDCTDNFAARYLINDVCIQLNKPFVYGAIFKFEGQVAVFNNANSPSYRCLFPNYPKEKNQPNCNDTGVLGVLPGIIGTMQATEVIKWIVSMEGLLDSTLLTYNAIKHEIRKINLPKRNTELCDNIKQNELTWAPEYCKTKDTIDWDELLTSREFQQIVDVRELHEIPVSHNCTTHKIPLSQFEELITKLNPEVPTAIYCKSGSRSNKAVAQLRKNGFLTVRSVTNGIDAFQKIKESTL